MLKSIHSPNKNVLLYTMSKKKLRYIVLTMLIALIGLVLIQYAFIRDSYRQKEQLFDQNIQSVLAEVVKKVEKEEARKFIATKASMPNKLVINTKQLMPKKRKSGNVNRQKPAAAPQIPAVPEMQMFSYNFPESEQVFMAIQNGREASDREQVIADSLRRVAEQHARRAMKTNRALSKLNHLNRSSFTFRTDTMVVRIDSSMEVFVGPSFPAPPPPPAIEGHFFHHQAEQEAEAARELEELQIQRFIDRDKKDRIELFEELVTEMQVLQLPLEKRFDPLEIDSLLQQELGNHGISLPYSLEIKAKQKDTILFTSAHVGSDVQLNRYQTTLFEDQAQAESALISVAFPDKEKALMRATLPSLLASMLLYMVVVASFAYTLNAILRQKKLSELKNDFINNMTHEFKTPVSTIMLASEALREPNAGRDQERIARLAGIIYDENLRLNEHVERVLNMARMDKGDIRLNIESLNLHDLINEVVEHLQLNLQAKKQTLQLNLQAQQPIIQADAFHAKNVIQNLIDNASKYSAEGKNIRIATEQLPEGIRMRVMDEGQGMKKEQINKIFDAFYRVPTGNIHDVKGFGIGLHYVQSVLKLMHGKIAVKSEFGSGSEFSVTWVR